MSRKFPIVIGVLVAAVLSHACSKDPEAAKQTSVRQGDAYVAQKKFREAIVEYRNAVQVDPRFGQARLKLADTYMMVGDLTNAYREYVRAADLLPDDVDAQMKAAGILLAARQYEDARARADKVLAKEPNHVDAQILRANALAGLSKLEDAIAEVETSIRNDPDHVASYASLGAMQMIRGEKGLAEVAFKKAVATNPKAIGPHLALANYYWATGRPDAVEAELKIALEIEPKHVLANRAMAYLFIGSGRAAAAEPHFKVIAEATSDGIGNLALADYYVSQQRSGDARRVLQQIVANSPPMATTAKIRLAALDMNGGDPAAASRLIDEVLTSQPANVEALLAKAQLLTRAKKLDEALAAVRKAAQADPESVRVQFALGRLQVLRQEPAEATAAFTKTLQLSPRMTTAAVELARLHLAAGRVNEAEQLVRSAIAQVPDYKEAHFLLARIDTMKASPAKAEPVLKALAKSTPSPVVDTELGNLELNKGNRVAARANFERALTKDPTNLDALRNLTRMDLQEKRNDAAKERVDGALKRKPNDPQLLTFAAGIYAAVGDRAGGERLVRQAIDADPSTLEAYALLSQWYFVERRLKETIEQWEKLAQLRPNSVGAHTLLGLLLQLDGRPDAARAQFERVLQIDPRAPVAANNLAWMYAEQGTNLDMALQLAQTAKSQLPGRPEVNDTLGWIYYKKGLSSLAIPPLLESVNQQPNKATYHYHLGLAYAAVGTKDKARASLQKALSLDANFTGADDARKVLAGLKG